MVDDWRVKEALAMGNTAVMTTNADNAASDGGEDKIFVLIEWINYTPKYQALTRRSSIQL